MDNNISESFNATIIYARHKPIISMLEEIMLYYMNKINDNMSRRITGYFSRMKVADRNELTTTSDDT